MCFHFLYSNPSFRILKIKIEYKFLNQISFFFIYLLNTTEKFKMKTKNTTFFKLTNRDLIKEKKKAKVILEIRVHNAHAVLQ